MKTYKVTIEDKTFLTFLVEAEDEDAAGDAAMDLFNEGEAAESTDEDVDIHRVEVWEE